MSNYRPLSQKEVAERLRARPRQEGAITPERVENLIKSVMFTFIDPDEDGISEVCICTIVLKNGHIEVGKSQLSDKVNSDQELAKHFAYLDARRGLFGIVDYLSKESSQTQPATEKKSKQRFQKNRVKKFNGPKVTLADANPQLAKTIAAQSKAEEAVKDLDDAIEQVAEQQNLEMSENPLKDVDTYRASEV